MTKPVQITAPMDVLAISLLHIKINIYKLSSSILLSLLLTKSLSNLCVSVYYLCCMKYTFYCFISSLYLLLTHFYFIFFSSEKLKERLNIPHDLTIGYQVSLCDICMCTCVCFDKICRDLST